MTQHSPSPVADSGGMPPTDQPSTTSGCYVNVLVVVVLTSAVFWFLAVAYFPSYHEAQPRARVSRAKADMRTIATALESYNVDYNAYPRYLRQTTTPIAYIFDIPVDVFSPDDPIQYIDVKVDVDGEKRAGWILWSIGPDGYNDVDVNLVEKQLEMNLKASEPALYDLEFDATNGTKSDGDIFHIFIE